MSIVVIDPGHGGTAPIGGSSPNNATGPAGTKEKTLALDVALRAASTLRAAGHDVVLTRDADVNLGLVERAAMAKARAADAFVSIHFNGFDDPSVQGTETWVHLMASQRSRDLALCVQDRVRAATGYRDRKVQSKALGVLKPVNHHEDTAACLAEISFITDPDDEARLQDNDYRQQLGDAIVAGVSDYLAGALKAARVAAVARKRAAAVLRRTALRSLDGDPIDHVVVLMLENRSFDHMLGALREVYPELDGIDPANPGVNEDPSTGRQYQQLPTETTAMKPDPKHELRNVLGQLDFRGVRCGGFVNDFRTAYGTTPEETLEVMAYFDYGQLPVLHRLATEFTLCDRWFSSVPGPTWTNRLFVHSGTAQGRVAMPDPPFNWNLHRYNQTTIYDRLNERRIAWRIYYGDIPQSLVLSHQRQPLNAARYRRFNGGLSSDSFFEKAAGPAGEFPAYAFIEPNYFFEHQNDQHPPSDVMKGEILIARVYNALRRNEDLWQRTLFVVTHDEHGGFYDHVYPGPAVPPDEHREEYTFDQFGVRVPALLISPWIGRGVLKTELDHTSLLRYLTDKWKLGPLGRRVEHANSFADVFESTLRTDTPRVIDEPAVPTLRASLAAPPVEPPLNDLQRALFAMTEALEAETTQAPDVKAARSLRSLEGPSAQAQVAADRVERFLQQQRAASSTRKG